MFMGHFLLSCSVVCFFHKKKKGSVVCCINLIKKLGGASLQGLLNVHHSPEPLNGVG